MLLFDLPQVLFRFWILTELRRDGTALGLIQPRILAADLELSLGDNPAKLIATILTEPGRDALECDLSHPMNLTLVVIDRHA